MEKKGLLFTYLLSFVNFNISRVQVVHGDVITYRQNVDKLAEQQQSKYLDLYTILPSEISMQLAEVSLALGAIEDQVLFDFFLIFFLSGHMHPLHWEAQVDILLCCFRFFPKREKFKEPEKSKTTSAQELMTSPRNSKQYLLNSRKSPRMWIMPKKKSRWVNCRVLPGNTNCSLWKKTHFYFFYLRACQRTWTLVAVSSQNWIIPCKSLVGGTRC